MRSKIIKVFVLLLVFVQVIDVVGMFRQFAVVYAQDRESQMIVEEETEVSQTDEVEESSSEVIKESLLETDMTNKEVGAEIQTIDRVDPQVESQNYGLTTAIYPELTNPDGSPKLDYLTGEELILYSKLSISGGYFPSKKVKFRITLPKKYFEASAQVSDGITFPVTSSLSEDSENIYFDIMLDNVRAGMDLGIPFRVKTVSGTIRYGTKMPITQTLYDEHGVELATDIVELEALTIGRYIYFNTFSDPFPVASEFVDKTGLISSSFVDAISFYAIKRGLIGSDPGDYQVEIALQENTIFKPEDNDPEWTYDAGKHTITRNFDGSSSSINSNFKVRYKDVYVDTTTYPVKYTAKVNVLNENGEVESRISANTSVKEKRFTVPTAGISSGKSMGWLEVNDRYFIEENKNKEFRTILTANHNGTSGSVFLKKIEDKPDLIKEKSPFTLTSIWLNSSKEFSGMENNTVYGVTASGEQVKVTENLGSDIFTLPEGQSFTSFYIEFDSAVEFKESTDRIQLQFTARRSSDYWEYLKENLNESHSAYNYVDIHFTNNNGTTTTISNSARIVTEEANNRLWLSYKPTKTTVFLGERFEISFGNSIKNITDPKLVNPKLYFILPRGLELASLDYTGDDVQYTEEKNFKNTGKTALIIQAKGEWSLPDFQKIFRGNALKLSLSFNTSAQYGTQKIDSYLTYENNGSDGIKMADGITYYNITESDPYQLLSGKMAKQEMLTYSTPIRLVPPSSLFVDTAVEVDAQQGFINGATDPIDQGSSFRQKISVMNYSYSDITKLVGINILPHAGDLSTLTDEAGKHYARGSNLGYLLEGPLEGPEGYTIYYSYDKPAKQMSENAENAVWHKEGAIDYNKVTMIKVVLNDGAVLEKNQEAAFTFPVKVPVAKEIKNQDKMVNTFTVTSNENIWIESRASEIPVTAYSVAGTVYSDSNKNSQKDPDERLLAGYEITLEQAGKSEPLLTTQTDSKGGYEFAPVPTRGEYTVRIKAKEGDSISDYLPSTAEVVATDVKTEAGATDGSAVITLTPDDTSQIVNMGLYSQRALSTIELTKVDHSTKQPLPKAQFRLEKADGTIVEEGLLTDENGKINITDLPIGDYQFIETAAPTDYQLEATPVPVKVTPTSLLIQVTKENVKLTKTVLDPSAPNKPEAGNRKGLLPATGGREMFNVGYMILFLWLLLITLKQIVRRYKEDYLNY